MSFLDGFDKNFVNPYVEARREMDDIDEIDAQLAMEAAANIDDVELDTDDVDFILGDEDDEEDAMENLATFDVSSIFGGTSEEEAMEGFIKNLKKASKDTKALSGAELVRAYIDAQVAKGVEIDAKRGPVEKMVADSKASDPDGDIEHKVIKAGGGLVVVSSAAGQLYADFFSNGKHISVKESAMRNVVKKYLYKQNKKGNEEPVSESFLDIMFDEDEDEEAMEGLFKKRDDSNYKDVIKNFYTKFNGIRVDILKNPGELKKQHGAKTGPAATTYETIGGIPTAVKRNKKGKILGFGYLVKMKANGEVKYDYCGYGSALKYYKKPASESLFDDFEDDDYASESLKDKIAAMKAKHTQKHINKGKVAKYVDEINNMSGEAVARKFISLAKGKYTEFPGYEVKLKELVDSYAKDGTAVTIKKIGGVKVAIVNTPEGKFAQIAYPNGNKVDVAHAKDIAMLMVAAENAPVKALESFSVDSLFEDSYAMESDYEDEDGYEESADEEALEAALAELKAAMEETSDFDDDDDMVFEDMDLDDEDDFEDDDDEDLDDEDDE